MASLSRLSPRGVVDALLEVTVVPSFTKIGPAVRRRLYDWEPLGDMTGRRILLTGGNSGLGFAAAKSMAALNADLTIVARNEERGRQAVESITRATGTTIGLRIADMSSLESVDALCDELLAAGEAIDCLIHNAGALHNERQESIDGNELTLATHVIGPFLMTDRLRPLLAAGDDPRIITMASGGLYSQGVSLADLQTMVDYSGTKAYARAKRAQLLLNDRWEHELADERIAVYTMHPGWAATPGVTEALPGFEKIIGPLLRSPEEGAETMVWLASEPTEELGNGGFWLDRGTRPEHRLPQTKSADLKVDALWEEISRLAGVDLG